MENDNTDIRQELEAIGCDLEVVHERSIESENTYKTSLVETEPNRSTAKMDNFYGDHKLITKRAPFNPSATMHIEKQLNISELDPKITPDASPFKERINRLEDRLSSKDKLILQMKMYQNELADAYEKLKAENVELKSVNEEAYSELRAQNSQARHKYQEDDQFFDMKEDLEAMAKEIESKDQKISKLRSRLKESKGQIEFLTDELSKSKTTLQKERDTLSSKLTPIIQKSVSEKYEAMIQDLEYKHFSQVKALEDALKLAQEGRAKGQIKRENSLRELNGLSQGPSIGTSLGPSMYSSQIRSTTKKLPEPIMKSQPESHSKQFIKFADACIDLMISIQGDDLTRRPSLKQVWRWFKGILEDFLLIKKFSRELEEMFQTNNFDEILLICEDLLTR